MNQTAASPTAANPVPVPPDVRRLLALCPLVAVSETAVGALGLAIATVACVMVSRLLVSCVERWLTPAIRLAATVFIVAGVLGGIGLAMSAWMPGLRQALGVFLALLASNVVILTTVTGKETTTLRAQAQALATCVDILIMLFVLGVVREIVGRGSLFTGASRLLGDLYAGFEVALFRLDMGFLLALLPPGAFIAAGLSIAALRLADAGRRREPSQ